MSETPEQTDERRARAVCPIIVNRTAYDNSSVVRKHCGATVAAVRASDAKAGMVLVPRAPVMLTTAITDVIETNYTGGAWRDAEIPDGMVLVPRKETMPMVIAITKAITENRWTDIYQDAIAASPYAEKPNAL